MKILLILFLSLATIRAQTSVAYSPVMGYNTVYLDAGASVVTNPFINASIYSGNAIVDGETFTINNVLSNNITDYPYYVEITSTNYNGSIFDVISNNKNIITASNVPSSLQGQDVSINIRPHTTIQQFVSNSTGLQDYSDALSTPDGNGGCVTYIYISGGIVAGDYVSPASNVIVYPEEGLIINNSANVSIKFWGELVYTNDIQ